MAEGPQENPTFAARAFIGGYVLAIAFKAADRFDSVHTLNLPRIPSQHLC
jgi:hypothetical protein